jgi:predicted Kef-type K+ transport protein
MQLDLRVPLGLLFAVLGAVLAAAGFVSGERVQEINVNLWWGVVLLMFGVGSLFVAGVRRP